MGKKRRKVSGDKVEVLRLWTYKEAEKAVPYLRGLATSLREHLLEAQGNGRHVQRLHQRPGRPDRSTLLAMEGAKADQNKAEEQFQEDLQELLGMHVFPVDVHQGLALIPFRKKEELAWFVFDLFEKNGLTSWRFHSDPLTQRRPLEEVQHDQPSDTVAI